MLALVFILLASLALTYAYKVPLTRTSRLSYGLQRSHSTRTLQPLKSFEVSDIINAQTLAEQESGSEQALAPLKLIIAGAPAAGKGTQCANIVEKFNVVHLSTGDMLRAAMKEGSELGMKAKEYMDNAQLVPDELITNVVCERLQQEDCQSQGWLLDGFPRTLPQAMALESAGMVPDCFLLLNVPQEALVERVTGRRTDPDTGKIYHMTLSPPPADDEPLLKRLVQRSDDTEEKIVVRYQDFLKHVGAIRACYNDVCVEIDGTMTPSEVGTKINGALEAKQASKNAKAMAALSERRASNLEARNLVGGLYLLYTVDRLLAMAFAKANFNCFPSALVGMITLFGGLYTVDKINPEKAANMNFTLTPASAFLKLWLTLLLIPPIVAVPLKVQLFRENGLKLLAIIAGGFIFNVASAGWLASPFGAGSSKTTTEGIAAVVTHDSSSSSRRAPRLPTLPAFTTPAMVTLASFVVCALSTSLAFDSVAESSRRIFGTALTVSSYLLAVQQTPKALQPVLHPALVSASTIIAGYGVLGVATGEGTKTALMSYFGQGSGPGDVLFKLLGTAIISFGVQLFQYVICSMFFLSFLVSMSPSLFYLTFAAC
jgi:adenylate kinase